MKIDKRIFLFYLIGLAMCHPLELIFNNYRFTHFYLPGLVIYLLTFTTIWGVISLKKDWKLFQLWTIGFVIGVLVEVFIVGEISNEIVPLLIVTIFFWGLLYTAVNYTLVRYISDKMTVFMK